MFKKKILIVFALFSILYGLFALYEELTGDFRIANITYELPLNPSLEIQPLVLQEQKNLEVILNQPFYFLGKGNQSYAFVSKDHQYVIKFFRFKRLLQKPKKLEAIFQSYKIAFECDQDNTGIFFIHLNHTNNQYPTLTVYDRLGFRHLVPLDSSAFVLQQKGQIAKKVLGNLLQKGKVEDVKMRIRSLLDMYVTEYKRGLHDKDYNLMHNTGFIKDKPIRIDAGRLRFYEEMKIPSFFLADLQKISSKRIDKWLKRYFPSYREEIMQDVEAKLEEIKISSS